MRANLSSPSWSREGGGKQALDALARLSAEGGQIAQAPDQVEGAGALNIRERGFQSGQVAVDIAEYCQSHILVDPPVC